MHNIYSVYISQQVMESDPNRTFESTMQKAKQLGNSLQQAVTIIQRTILLMEDAANNALFISVSQMLINSVRKIWNILANWILSG